MATKTRKASEKQVKILEAVGRLRASAKEGAPEGFTPSQIGQECGKEAGSPAADWAYPAIKTLVRKEALAKVGNGRYDIAAEPKKAA